MSAIKQFWDLSPVSPFIPTLTWRTWCHEVQSKMESCWKLVFPGWIFHFILNLCCYYYYSIICCIKCEPPATEPSGGEGKRLFSESGMMPVPSSSSQLNPDRLFQYCPVNHLESILINALCLLHIALLFLGSKLSFLLIGSYSLYNFFYNIRFWINVWQSSSNMIWFSF